MNKIITSELLARLEAQAETHLHKAVQDFQNYDSARLKASGGGWSIAECLEHLNTYGDHYLPAIAAALAKAKKEKTLTFKSSWLGNYFVNMMDPEKSSKKYKAAAKHIPNPGIDGHAAVAKFIAQQEELIRLLRAAVNYNLQKISIPISLTRFIHLNIGDTFRFLVMHNERHIRQAMRN